MDLVKLVSHKLTQITYDKLYLAVSGGVDSSVLMHIIKTLGVNFELIHVNLKREINNFNTSDYEYASLLCYAESLGLKLHTSEVTSKAKAYHDSRIMKHQIFSQYCNHNNGIIMAHHQDDQIENFFIQLLRGKNLKSLFIPEYTKINQGFIYRPLLEEVTKKDIYEYAYQHKVKYVDSLANDNLKFCRNFIRHKLLPLVNHQDPDCYNLKHSINLLIQNSIWVTDYLKLTLETWLLDQYTLKLNSSFNPNFILGLVKFWLEEYLKLDLHLKLKCLKLINHKITDRTKFKINLHSNIYLIGDDKYIKVLISC